MIATLNEADKIPLKAQLDDLQQQIDELDEEIDRKLSGAGTRGRQLDWEAKLSKIDYKEANEIATDLLDREGFDGRFSDGGAAVFLLQDGLTMGAKWYVRQLLDVLTEKYGSGNVRHVPAEVRSYESLDQPGVLGKLAEHFDVGPDAEGGLSARTMINKIVRSLRHGSAVLTELTIWDDLADHDWFFPWFLNDFWRPLVDELLALGDQEVRFVAVIVLNGAIAPGSLGGDAVCALDDFHSGKLLELPLQCWQEKDIRAWLIRHSGLSQSLNAQQILKMARTIYSRSDGGKPKSVYVVLMDNLK